MDRAFQEIPFGYRARRRPALDRDRLRRGRGKGLAAWRAPSRAGSEGDYADLSLAAQPSRRAQATASFARRDAPRRNQPFSQMTATIQTTPPVAKKS